MMKHEEKLTNINKKSISQKKLRESVKACNLRDPAICNMKDFCKTE